MSDPQCGDIPASQSRGCPPLPSAAVSIPIQANIMTAAWQEAETLLGLPAHWLVGMAMRGHTTGFAEVGGLHGDPNACPDRGSFQDQPYRTAAPENQLLRLSPQGRGVLHFQGILLMLSLDMLLVWQCWRKVSVGSFSASHHGTCVLSLHHLTLLLANCASLFFYC